MHDGDSSEVGASRFAIQDVHRIGILDVRLFNTDRHAGKYFRLRTFSRHLHNMHCLCTIGE